MKKYSKKIQHLVESVFIILLVAPLITACFTLAVNESGREVLDAVYMQSLLIIIPVLLTEVLEKRCKYFLVYLLFGAALTVMIWKLAAVCGGLTMQGNQLVVFQGLLVIETWAVWGLHLHDRLLEVRKPHTPSFAYSAVFVIYYIVGILFDGKQLCDIAFYSLLLYLCITSVYVFLAQTERYISLNHDVKKVPVSRLFNIGGAMLASILLLVLLLSVPCMIAGENRYYTDLRDRKAEVQVREDNWEMDIPQIQTNGMSIEEQMLMQEGQIQEMPEWVNYLFHGIVYILLAGSVVLCVKAIFQKLSQFQESFSENDDVIEELEEEKVREPFFVPRKVKKAETEREKIRQQYRKMIRKYRKECPYDYETPQEIEKEAGLLENKEMKALHVRYEEARYADETRPIIHKE